MAKEEATLLLRVKQTGQKILQKTSMALGAIAKGSAIAGTAIVGFVGKGVQAFKVQETAVNALNQSLVQQGIFTKDLSKKYQDMASRLQQVTTFGDEAIISAQSQLQAYLGQQEVTEDLTKSVLDFASGMKIDLKSAADLVGKSIGSSTNALTRYGISLDAGLTKEEKLAQITEKLNNRFGGQAEAAAKGLGSLDQLSNTWGDFMEVVGERVAPLVVAISKRFKAFIENKDEMNGFIKTMKKGFSIVAKSASIVVSSFKVVGGVIGTVLGAATESVNQVLQGNFSRAKEIVSMGMQDVSSIITKEQNAHNERMALINEKMALIDDALKERQLEKMKNDEQLLLQSQLRKQQLEADARSKEITDKQKHDAKLLGLEIKSGETRQKLEERLNKAKESARASSLSTIAGLQSSSNKTLATIGKAAALTQIAISGPQAVAKALAAFPPPFNFVAAGAVGAAVAAQAAQVAGIQLADGGIVPATPGGVQATIGEGGRDEAVIPLDESGGIGGNITIVVNGGLLGDESSAREFAVAVDQELFRLRQNNESVAFDEGII